MVSWDRYVDYLEDLQLSGERETFEDTKFRSSYTTTSVNRLS